jgi:4-azaleucine resistance transporter AzlC
MTRKRQRGGTSAEIAAAARASGVVWTGIATLGVGFGILVTSYGFPWWLAPLISAVVFAGSVEFLLVTMLASAAPVTAIATMALVVNARHAFYGLSFPLERVQGRVRRAYSVFALSDEAYAMAASGDPATMTGARILWTQVGLHAAWVMGSLVGGLAGLSSVLAGVRGVGFVLTTLFVVLALDAFTSRPDPTTAVLATVASVVALAVARGSMIMVAMALLVVTLVIRHRTAEARRAA